MNNFAFLPQDYQAPKASNYYMKLQDGENKLRILSQPILGWEDWQDKKPVRYRFENKPLKPIDPKHPVKHFWAMIVWNYLEDEIQILQITQATIRNSIEALCKDQDWGAPFFYDIKIIKKGEGKDTEYLVNPLPHKPISQHIIERFNERKCNLEALFDNQDPFSKEHSTYTLGKFQENLHDSKEPLVKVISELQAEELKTILEECGKDYMDLFLNMIKKLCKANSLSEIPITHYQELRNSALKKMEETYEKQKENFVQGNK